MLIQTTYLDNEWRWLEMITRAPMSRDEYWGME